MPRFAGLELGAKPPGGLTTEPHPNLTLLLSANRRPQGDSRWRRGWKKTSLGSWPFSSPEGLAESVPQANSSLRHHHRHYDQGYSGRISSKFLLQPQYYLQSGAFLVPGSQPRGTGLPELSNHGKSYFYSGILLSTKKE